MAGIDRLADRMPTITQTTSADQTRAGAFEQALLDELARDRSFHVLDGQLGLQNGTSFDRAFETRYAAEGVDPSHSADTPRADVVGRDAAAGRYGRADFEAAFGNTRRTGSDDRSESDLEAGYPGALWIGDHIAASPASATDAFGFADVLPVDSGPVEKVFFNGDGRPIVVPLIENEQQAMSGDLPLLDDGAAISMDAEATALSSDPLQAMMKDALLSHAQMISEHWLKPE